MTKNTSLKTYTELSRLHSFEDRFEYLKIPGRVGESTFGFDRWLNQKFYRSAEWKHIRNKVIARDNGCDLGIEGHEIYDRILVHHMNPLTQMSIVNAEEILLDTEYLICVSHITHNAIHFGDKSLLAQLPKERKPHDTIPWKKGCKYYE